MTSLHLSEISTYPIKSCGPAEDITVHNITDYGLEYDREWMVARPNGTFLTQRQFPELALVRTRITDDELHISAPSHGHITVPLERDPDEEAKAQDITIFKKDGSAVNQGTAADDFFSDYLDKKVQLMRSVKPRPVEPECTVPQSHNATRFADGFPFLLASETSLELLNQFAEEPLAMARFRPNIVVSGEVEGFEEDYWRELRIGPMRAFIVRACARCPIPDVNPSTGQRSESKPASNALGEIRSGVDPVGDSQGVFFGQNMVHESAPGLQLKVGDQVVITDKSPHANVILA